MQKIFGVLLAIMVSVVFAGATFADEGKATEAKNPCAAKEMKKEEKKEAAPAKKAAKKRKKKKEAEEHKQEAAPATK